MIEFKDKRVVKLNHFQKRNEKHGKDLVPAVDLGITLQGPNRLLDMLHAELRPALFRAGEQNTSATGQTAMDLPITELPHVRVPKLMLPLKLEHEQTGMLLHVEYGTGGKSDIVLALVKLSKVRVHAVVEGGSCEVHFVLSSSNEITERIIGKLAMLEGYDITITLTQPEVEQPEKPLTEADVFPGLAGSVLDDKRPLTAEEVFTGGAGQDSDGDADSDADADDGADQS